ncbi:uncharacterized protein LOC111397659 isoform X2 [Olea europaea var. sylvestris]|uniref:uncharacterized protein LOC111396724 isoform X2 n=1 Tax=Olea europaea var. sylvestris TaxID=158386 RepID=UPI000C1D15D9|nr:uncharacterized protein LOC111396724 isoform X2 [Olea europaea var. sylvestris]XP_022880432.1 uncharacterized protein LOC111397659 isoform X2 [Olea europaea var. sylvestris]
MATLLSNFGIALHSTQQDVESGAWLLNSGATNHMTFTTTDFTQTSLPRRSNIVNTNCVTSLVTRAGTDILTKEIIGRGTKRGGLYHMEDFSIGRAHFTHLFTSNKEQQILLWRC